MPDTPLDERKFTDEEVREILKKAVEKKAKAESASIPSVSKPAGEAPKAKPKP